MVNLRLLFLTVFLPYVRGDSCNFNQLPVQRDFHLYETQFAGVWYEVERTVLQWGANTWHSATYNFFLAPNGTMLFAYTGWSNKGCSRPEYGYVDTSSNSDTWKLISEHGTYQVTFQVAYTDFRNVALVYMCYGTLNHGICTSDHMHVSLFTRHAPLTDQERAALVRHMGTTCFIADSHLEAANTGLCEDPKPSIEVLG